MKVLIIAIVHSGNDLHKVAKFIRKLNRLCKTQAGQIHTRFEVVVIANYGNGTICKPLCGNTKINFNTADKAAAAAENYAYVSVHSDASDLSGLLNIIYDSSASFGNGGDWLLLPIDFRKHGAAFPAGYSDLLYQRVLTLEGKMHTIITRSNSSWDLRNDCQRICTLFTGCDNKVIADMSDHKFLSAFVNKMY